MRGLSAGLVLGVLGATAVVRGQPRSIDWQVNGGGGGALAGRTMRLDGTLSQVAAGPLSAQGGSIDQGFWSQIIYGPSSKIVAGEPVSIVSSGAATGAERVRVSVLPNTFGGAATVSCWIPRDGTLRIDLFDARGVPVTSLYRGSVMSGRLEMELDCGPLPTGTYYLRLRTDEETVARTIKVVR